ncbi:MAG: ribosomal protein S18-alanine N-acetyltransferase [Oscillospiraceae bacterium]
MIEIKPMQKTHITQLAQLEKICFSCPWSEAAIAVELTNPRAKFFCATEGDIVAAYIGMYSVLDEGYIANLAVMPQYRGQGIAFLLITHLQELAQNLGISFITLEVRKSNLIAIKLYQKCGFLSVGMRKGFYTEPDEDALLMTWRR